MTSLGQCKGMAFTSQVPVQTPGHREGLFRSRHCLLNTCDGEDMTNLPPNFPPPPPGGPIYGQHLPPGWENRKESDFWDTEVVPGLVEVEVAVPRLTPALR
jgi:hypothetical protein